jgi:hypothetical protein
VGVVVVGAGMGIKVVGLEPVRRVRVPIVVPLADRMADRVEILVAAATRVEALGAAQPLVELGQVKMRGRVRPLMPLQPQRHLQVLRRQGWKQVMEGKRRGIVLAMDQAQQGVGVAPVRNRDLRRQNKRIRT